MSNIGTMYKYEVKKILCRRITLIVMAVVMLIMAAMNTGEYIMGKKVVNTEETKLIGRTVDDKLLSEMRKAAVLKEAELSDGEKVSMGIEIKDPTYKPLLDYLTMLSGNNSKAYNMTEKQLYDIFSGVINDGMKSQNLTPREIKYWRDRMENGSQKLSYDKIQNSWADSVTIIYTVSFLTLIAIGVTLSGVFSDETNLRTDALIFSSVNGRRKLFTSKFLAGMTVGVLEALLIVLACVGTEFAVSGTGGIHSSVQFFVGPTAMNMEIGKAFLIFMGILFVISVLFSVMTMFLSQVCRNSIAVVAVMMVLWLLSMVNIPNTLGIIARAWKYLPVTFLGSWTFTDYHLIWLFGKPLTIIESAPIIYIIVAIIMAIGTKFSYNKYQVNGR